jgi:hypothetical protein
MGAVIPLGGACSSELEERADIAIDGPVPQEFAPAKMSFTSVQRNGPAYDKMPTKPISSFIASERELLRTGGEVISWQENQPLRLLCLAIGIERQVRRSHLIAAGHAYDWGLFASRVAHDQDAAATPL